MIAKPILVIHIPKAEVDGTSNEEYNDFKERMRKLVYDYHVLFNASPMVKDWKYEVLNAVNPTQVDFGEIKEMVKKHKWF